MRGVLCAAALLLPLLAACTRDFSAYGFDHGSQRDSASRSPDAGHALPDAGNAAEEANAEPLPPPVHAGREPDAAAQAGHVALTPDVPDRPADQLDPSDAGAEDAARIDAGQTECAATFRELSLPDARATECQSCACDSCARAILDCLHYGSQVERGLCRDVLSCALRERCQEYDCYCSSPRCGRPDGSGDGPCGAEILAAAGGNRGRVMSLRNANPRDRDEPLVRAAQAIACILGERRNSGGPTVAGSCNALCQ